METLSNELLLCIAENLQSHRDIARFAKVNRRHYANIIHYLYHRAVKQATLISFPLVFSQNRKVTVLGWAAEKGIITTASRALDAGARDIGRALHRAAERDHEALVRFFLEWLQVERQGWFARAVEPERGGEMARSGFYNMPSDLTSPQERLAAQKRIVDYREAKELYPPISQAALSGRNGMCRLLISFGADVNLATPPSGITPLLAAMERYDWHQIKRSTCNLLLDAGADPRMANAQGETPMHLAVLTDSRLLIDRFLKLGADINAQTVERKTPLFMAVEKCQRRVCQMLLEHGADPGIDTDNRGTLLMGAVINSGDDPIFTMLAETGRVRYTNYACSVLVWAVREKRHFMARYMIDHGTVDVNLADPRTGFTPLLQALLNDDEDMVRYLVEKGKARLDVGRRRELPPRLPAPVYFAIQRGNEAIIRFLLDNASDLELGINDPADPTSTNPLLEAAFHGREETVRYLIESGRLDPSWACQWGRDVLSYVASSDNVSLASYLVESGVVDLKRLDRYGRGALSHAAESGCEDMVHFFLSTGRVDVNEKDKRGRTPLFYAVAGCHIPSFQTLLLYGADMKAGDISGETPLSIAFSDPLCDFLRLLVEAMPKASQNSLPPSMADLDLDAPRVGGETLLIKAVQRRNGRFVRGLVESGLVDVNKKNHVGRTALSYAVSYGERAISQQLLDCDRIKVNLQDHAGRTPLWYAAHDGNFYIARLLARHGYERQGPDGGENDAAVDDDTEGLGLGDLLPNHSPPAELDLMDNRGVTPLATACYRGWLYVVKLLLRSGRVNPNTTQRGSLQIPLHAAVIAMATEAIDETWLVPVYEYINIILKLVTIGRADINATDVEGKTALCFAVEHNSILAVDVLLSLGADARVEDAKGTSPIGLARVREGLDPGILPKLLGELVVPTIYANGN